MNLTYLSFLSYFLILFAIVFATFRKKTTEEEFLIGKRSLNFYITALSAHASDMSSWLFMAFPSLIYLYGIDHAWIGLGLLVGMFLNWQLVAPKLRLETEKYNVLTISGYFSKRLNDKKGILLLVTGLMSLIFFAIYISSGLLGMGLVFEEVFNLPYVTGITLGISAVLIYTFFGGYVAVAWTDLFQALFLLVVIIAVPIYAFMNLPADASSISFDTFFQGIKPHVASGSVLQTIFLILSMGLGYFGQLHIVSKFMGIRDPKELNKSKWTGMSWQLLSIIASIFVGLVAVQFFSTPADNPELIFVVMVKSLFNPFAAGFILCAILAAIISTMDSQILVLASVITEDFYKGFIRKKASSKELLWISRSAVVLSCIFAFCIAFYKASSIWGIVLFAWAGLGSCFGPLILFCLHSKRVNWISGLFSVITGGIIVGFWGAYSPEPYGYQVSPLIPGFIGSFLVLYISSRFYEPTKVAN